MIPFIIFWISILLLAHSYLLYPIILQLLARNKKLKLKAFVQSDKLPFVSIIMSVHNEEMVIVEKIRSIYYTLYPMDKFEVLVGSDASSDGTNRICRVYKKNYPGFRFFEFSERQGKPAVINSLVNEARGQILIMTDAKVFFTIDTIFELVKYFKEEKTAIVGGNILNEQVRRDGISRQEKAFMSRELQIKYYEGLLWGKTIGVYGAIYAMRKDYWEPVPAGYSVDDFFITMTVLRRKGQAILNPDAITRENVPNLLATEFRRKVRISSGNFQNLHHFRACLWPPFTSLAFAFFSHKVIRWIGPFLILLLFASNSMLLDQGLFYSISFFTQLILFILPLFDLFLRKIDVHVVLLRFVTHFFAMNAALLAGFFKHLFGIKTNIWQPTRR